MVALVATVFFVLTFGAADAEAVPSVTFKCTPAPQNCSGWYRSNVSVEWTVAPANSVVDGCRNNVITTDTPGTNEVCVADDGEARVAVEFRIKLDKTAPVVTGGAPARGADVNGWYNHAVPITFSGSDQTSGLASCTSTTYGGPDGGAASLSGTCIDNAGNVSSPFPYGLKYDETAPAVAGATPERSPNAAGWFNRPVRFDVAGTDATSGIADCPAVTYGGADSATASFTGTCRDQAGNSASRTFGLKYDATAPAVTGGAPGRGPDVNGWYNHAVSVAFSGSDQLSGVDTCATPTYGGPDAGAASLLGTCTDRAGNVSSPFAFALKYDETAPVVTGGRPGRAADVDGWYNHAVSVDFSGSDQTAGVDACMSATYAGPDSGTASLSGTCRDRAGNVSSPFGFGLKYDQTAPVLTGANPARPANSAGWFNRPVDFSIVANDATSGVAACPSVTYGGPDSATASFSGSCRDRAGNSANRTFGLKYDSTAPAATAGQPVRGPDVNGWYNHAVSVDFSGTDPLSGIDTCTSRSYAGPDSATASLAGTCTDDAGNVSAPLGFALKYDATAPVVSGGQAGRAADMNGWYNHPVSIGFGGSDQTSGIDACTNTTYGGPDSGAASVSGSCTDKAGNPSGSLGFGLKYDDTDPAVTGARAERPPDHGDWFTRPVRFDIAGTDAMSGLLECPPVIYFGPDSRDAGVTGRCHDRAGNSSSRAFPLSFDATAPPLTNVKATPGDRRVALSWNTSLDAELVEIVRTPGLGLEPATMVFRGLDVLFVDWNVDNGVRYAYEVRVEDAAGNAGSKTVTSVPDAPPASLGVGVIGPGPGAIGDAVAASPGEQAPGATAPRRGLIAPLPGAVVRAGHPPLLRWTPVPGARYYNVQLFRGRKIFSVWPTRPLYQLKMRWSYRGKRQRLVPGRYHWIVWPGFGPRSKTNYGKKIGRSAFEVKPVPPVAAMSGAG